MIEARQGYWLVARRAFFLPDATNASTGTRWEAAI
uniref:Uncharacterized protein n=1 Tax=Pyricularia oryzae (strain P131) TaxID=1143193 RepID=L7JIB3_PYRO1